VLPRTFGVFHADRSVWPTPEFPCRAGIGPGSACQCRLGCQGFWDPSGVQFQGPVTGLKNKSDSGLQILSMGFNQVPVISR
jgi:hypothetical protein